jgi:hypothetical protein
VPRLASAFTWASSGIASEQIGSAFFRSNSSKSALRCRRVLASSAEFSGFQIDCESFLGGRHFCHFINLASCQSSMIV